MLRVKALRSINFGILESAGPMVCFEEGEVKEFPNREPYSEFIANAIEDKFLTLVTETKSKPVEMKPVKKEKSVSVKDKE